MGYHRTVWLSAPGGGKSTCGLSYPSVEQHVFGSSEEETAIGFKGRTDILPPLKLSWMDTLKLEEAAKLTTEQTPELEVARLTEIGRMRNVIRYRRYLRQLEFDLKAGKRPELKTVFLDNFTPFAEDFQDYIKWVYQQDFITKEGNFNSIAFSIRYGQELMSFLRDFVSLPCHTVMSCHIAMSLDEETASAASFMEDSKKGIKRPKEWQPFIMGKAKYAFTGLFNHAFFLFTEESAGQSTKYLAKLEADTSNIGIGKSRVQPYANPRQIHFSRGHFYEEFEKALQQFTTTGQPV